MTEMQQAVLFGSLIIWGFIGTCIEAIIADKFDKIFLATPTTIYEETDLNWFGTIFCFIFIRLISPIVTVIGLIITIIVYIWTGICCLFTVGREKD